MAKTVSLSGPAVALARDAFRSYYRNHPVPAPPRVARREFASFSFSTESLMRRHTAFGDAAAMSRFLADEAPRHVYYSAAYYRHPAEGSMAKKEWLGADLIFDLDADHLRGAQELDYAGQLRLAKERFTVLLDDFLFRDFGIDPDSCEITFSGGRGYHAHVRDERFLHLTSAERRELVDYILGVGLDPSRALGHRTVDLRPDERPDGAGRSGGGRPGRRRSIRQIEVAPPDAPGWYGRIGRAVRATIDRWRTQPPAQTWAEFRALDVHDPAARRWVQALVRARGEGPPAPGSDDALGRREIPEPLLAAIARDAAVAVQGETDAPVTTDIHRLIRLPGSLHGGTGLRVVPVDYARLDAFDPLRDAVWEGEEAPAVPVRYLTRVAGRLGPWEFRGDAGSSEELPRPAALFLILRGEAELRSGPGS